MRGEWLPGDNQYDDQDRYFLAADHAQNFAENWRGTLAWRDVSDADYLRDFADDVDLVAQSYLPKRADLDYFGEALRLQSHAVAYDSVDADTDAAEEPYATVPAINLTFAPRTIGAVVGGLDAQYAEFRHDSDIEQGKRWRVKPSLSLPITKPYGYLTPKIALQTIGYSLNNPDNADDSPSAEIPIYSLDAGLFFEREMAGGFGAVQTLEPRLFYVKIPHKNQHDFPSFDVSETAETAGNFAQIFRANRLTGGDRVGDTEQIAVAASSRILDAAGRQRLQMRVGQIYYLRDREIDADGDGDDDDTDDNEPQTDNDSGVLAELTAGGENWSASTFARWRDDDDELADFRLNVKYNRARRTANLAYTFHANTTDDAADNNDNDTADTDDTEQINLTFASPLAANPRWQARYAVAYSLARDEVQSSAIGLRYDACCWAFHFGAKRYLDGEGAHKNRFVFTLELADLGRLRSRF